MLDSPVGHVIVVHGTDEQRARLLPSLADRPDAYCLGFSEPEHGSDLAAVETRGEVLGTSEIAVSGVKTWIAHAERATAMLVLCRTEPAAPRYHNLSCVLVPLPDNSVELRPIRQMSGDSSLFDVSLDGARAPLSNVIGGRGNGWGVAMTALRRARTSRWLDSEREFWELVQTARHYGRDRDPLVRQQLAWAYAQVHIIRVLAERAQSGPESSLLDVLGSEYHRRLGEIAVDVVGTDSLVRPDGEAYATSPWQRVFLTSRADTIASGTSEIQRTVIAERVLGLPK